MVEMNKHEEWQNDLEYITELQSDLAKVTKELAEAKEAMREIKKTLSDEFDGVIGFLNAAMGSTKHANFKAREMLGEFDE